MGNVFHIEGHAIEQDAPCRNPQIAQILEELWQLNDLGLLDVVVVGGVKIDRTPIMYSSTPSVTNIATVLGAIHLAEKFYTDNLTLHATESHLPAPPEGA